MLIIPVILCGGSGTRMWPLSRGGFPKQYLALYGDDTLVQQTALRLKGLNDVGAPIFITNQDQRFLVAEQMRAVGIKPASVVLEPVGRNTAPAVAAAAIVAARQDPDAIILVLPSDHVIQHDQVFCDLVNRAAAAAKVGKLVTFGIQPTSPNTGYGYIRRGKPLANLANAYYVDAFVEKPNAEKAGEFLANGSYYWNSGMFLFKASAYVEELTRIRPDIMKQVLLSVEHAETDRDFLRLDVESFAACPEDSIDYAVMEHTDHAVVVEAAGLGWSDIGSWDALAEVADADAHGNNLIGDILVDRVSNCYIRAENRMIAAIGVDDLVIVETADAILVSTKECAQDVKKIVNRLSGLGRSESVTHRKVFRPWGSYEGLDQSDRFQVKRIIVNPGCSLSLQMHHHRAEHWIVVKGTAIVVNGEQELMLTENQSTYIPLGVTHRLANPGKIPLELIEVQSGPYLGEDDIVRFDDNYGRAPVK